MLCPDAKYLFYYPSEPSASQYQLTEEDHDVAVAIVYSFYNIYATLVKG